LCDADAVGIHTLSKTATNGFVPVAFAIALPELSVTSNETEVVDSFVIETRYTLPGTGGTPMNGACVAPLNDAGNATVPTPFTKVTFRSAQIACPVRFVGAFGGTPSRLAHVRAREIGFGDDDGDGDAVVLFVDPPPPQPANNATSASAPPQLDNIANRVFSCSRPLGRFAFSTAMVCLRLRT
jgi:hypothetical protein